MTLNSGELLNNTHCSSLLRTADAFNRLIRHAACLLLAELQDRADMCCSPLATCVNSAVHYTITALAVSLRDCRCYCSLMQVADYEASHSRSYAAL
jgi:hypothetical protein